MIEAHYDGRPSVACTWQRQVRRQLQSLTLGDASGGGGANRYDGAQCRAGPLHDPANTALACHSTPSAASLWAFKAAPAGMAHRNWRAQHTRRHPAVKGLDTYAWRYWSPTAPDERTAGNHSTSIDCEGPFHRRIGYAQVAKVACVPEMYHLRPPCDDQAPHA